jgi:hypothetical protein
VAELADARDLKSRGRIGRAGSIPAPGTNLFSCEVGAITVNRTGAAADGEEEKRDFRSASDGD